MHFKTHILLLFVEAIWTANIHDCIHAKLWPVMGAGYHTIHHTTYRHNYGHFTIWMDWMFRPASNWYQSGDPALLSPDFGSFSLFPVTMPPRRQRNVEDVTLRDQIAELRQSNQALQQMMNELLQRIPVTKQSTFQSEGSGRTIFNNEEEDDHSTSSTSITVAEPAFVNPWSMDRLARALENSDRSIQVHVPDFDGKLNANEYCDWTASLEAPFDWKDLSDERKVQFVATKLKGHALIWWQQYQRSRDRKGIPRVNTWTEMKLKLDEKFLPLDYAQPLYHVGLDEPTDTPPQVNGWDASLTPLEG
ncbi:hypothetical protein RHSIM_Rhsim08G0083200 [Rhododendron simsii]|uniref:Retrotransposon gag domain-containing protein n=1 Tax=Rhododendron simsii TaxID=118357 RepID=A0A834LDE4_RHOSS|nr:hypothetical protein RHSIM_Rhsim08G0083200 [Rhododendron simsii]